MNTTTTQDLNKLLYQGGLQNYFPREEGRIYVNNLFVDSLKNCVSKFDSNMPTNDETMCIKNYMMKNYALLNGNLN